VRLVQILKLSIATFTALHGFATVQARPTTQEVDAMLVDIEQHCAPQLSAIERFGQTQGLSIADMRFLVADMRQQVGQAPTDILTTTRTKENTPDMQDQVGLDMINCVISLERQKRSGTSATDLANKASPLDLRNMPAPPNESPKKELKLYFIGGTFVFPDNLCTPDRKACLTGGVKLILRAQDFQGYRFAVFGPNTGIGRFAFNNDPFEAGVEYNVDFQDDGHSFYNCIFERGQTGTVPAEETARDLHNPAMVMHISCPISKKGREELERLGNL